MAKKGIGIAKGKLRKKGKISQGRSETSAKIVKFGRKPPTKLHCARLVEESAL